MGPRMFPAVLARMAVEDAGQRALLSGTLAFFVLSGFLM
jgi:hypothetical protein